MPLEVIESTDSITELVRFETSPVYELIISPYFLLEPGRRAAWSAAAQAELPPALVEEARAIYEPFAKGALFFELPVDYADHHDTRGFIRYVRDMDPAVFIFYLVGRILSVEDIAAIGSDYEALKEALQSSPFYTPHCLCLQAPLDRILADTPAFQRRLTDLWQWYWDSFLQFQIDDLRPHWENALNDKQGVFARSGGQALYEHVTNHAELPPPLPPDHPITELVFIPIYLAPSPVYMLYGYGNVTVLFDSERTEARIAEIERTKEQALAILKALSDNSRLEILRLVARYESKINGKAIAEKLSLSAPTVSRHLTQLKDAGVIVEESSDNRAITYRLQKDTISAVPEMVLEYLYQ